VCFYIRNREKQNRDFKGVWIPAEIYLIENLGWVEKILLIEIDSLDGENGCFATNEYFADFLKIKENTVSVYISKLKDLGLIYQESFNGRERILRSNIKKILKSAFEKNQSLPLKKIKACHLKKSNAGFEKSQSPSIYNNTSNNTSNNREEKTPSQIAKDFFSTQEDQEKIINFLSEKGLPREVATIEVKKFVSYWTEPTRNGKKEKWELERTFDVKRRFTTWIMNFTKYNKNYNEPKARKY
jgi:hypothetical protein